MKSFFSVTLFVVLAAIFGNNCNAQVLKSNGTAGKDLNAETLVSYGRQFNHSLITMIGRVIANYHLCDAWSEWSECGATLHDYFSTRTRTRRCGVTQDRYGRRDEIETDVCEGSKTKLSCPRSYQITGKGFCFKLYLEKKNHSDAQAVCRKDGGYLVNIDSDQKYDSVKEMLLANKVTSEIYIDGKYVNSRWTFSHGSTTGYFHWYRSYPQSIPSYVYLGLTGNRSDVAERFRTFNEKGSGRYSFICEIPLY